MHKMKDFTIPTLVLALVTFCAASLLAGVNAMTYKRIEQLEAEKEQNALQLVLPGYKLNGDAMMMDESDDSTRYWTGKNDAGAMAYAFITESPGYSSSPRVMVGIDQNQKILGISVLSQNETPGLGARCIEVASKNTFLDVITGNAVEETDQTPWFQKQFKGLNGAETIGIVKKGDWNEGIADSLLKNNEISAITGATITSTAIRDAIDKGVAKFKPVIQTGGQE